MREKESEEMEPCPDSVGVLKPIRGDPHLGPGGIIGEIGNLIVGCRRAKIRGGVNFRKKVGGR